MEWTYKAIDKYNGKYLVSKCGVVAYVDRKGDTKVMKQCRHRNGHMRVKLMGKNYPVHRLVLETWSGPAPSKSHVCRHLNDIPDDNRLENLQWGTLLENAKDVQVNWNKRVTIINDMRSKGFTPEDISILAKIPILELCKIC